MHTCLFTILCPRVCPRYVHVFGRHHSINVSLLRRKIIGNIIVNTIDYNKGLWL